MPNFEVVVPTPLLLRLIVPLPKRCDVVVVPSDERLIVPEPKRRVVTCSPWPRVTAPSPKRVVV